MSKKYLTSLIIVIVVIVVGVTAVVLGTQLRQVSDGQAQKQPEQVASPVVDNLDNQQVENTDQITLKEARAEIERIFSDDSIDISDWPTYTNTGFGWSIKYHPDAEWLPNSMTETVEEASGPSLYLGSNSLLGVRVQKNHNPKRLDFREFTEGVLDNNVLYYKEVADNSVLGFVDYDQSDFVAISKESNNVIMININEYRSQPLHDQLIKSLSTFKFLGE